ncbi:YaaR family protein, partial [Bacillus haynesii]
MKISQELRTMIEKQQTPPARGENVSASFKEKMNIQSGKLRVEQLTMLLTDIEAFGKRLSKSR